MPTTPDSGTVTAATVRRYVEFLAAQYENDPGTVGWRYRSPYHVVAAHGIEMTPAPRPTGLRKMPYKQCFANAGKYVVQQHWSGTYEPSYCEGYAIGAAGLAVHHGWVLDPEEHHVIDLTWVNKGYAERAYLGVAFDTRFMVRHWSTERIWDVLSTEVYLRDGFPEGAIR
jgi:hypothetical protein